MRRALALLLGALALASRAHGATVIDASEAAGWVGSTVTVEGDVAAVRSEPIGLVLELAPGGPTSVRAVLVPSLISSLPRSPERIYEGKRVRVTGLLQRFKGRPELVLESPGQIEVVDVAGAPSPTTTTTTTIAAPPPSTTTTRPEEPAATPTVVPVPPPQPTAPPATTLPAPAPPAPRIETAPPTTLAPIAAPPPEPEPAPKPLLTERLAAQACERARTRWHDAAARARKATADLTRCLDAATFACHGPAAALAPILADLEWAEQEVADRCE
jgi:hypothetical protein